MDIKKYSSLEEKAKVFGNRYKRISDSATFDKWYNGNHGWYFRGSNEASHKNYTSAQRLYITNNLDVHGITINDLVKKQIESLKTVRDGLIFNYFSSLLKAKPNDLLLLSFAQHMRKGIAPLLDFTLDGRVALFFMTDGCKFPKEGKKPENNDISSIEDYASIYYLTKTTSIAYKKRIERAVPVSDPFSKKIFKSDANIDKLRAYFQSLYEEDEIIKDKIRSRFSISRSNEQVELFKKYIEAINKGYRFEIIDNFINNKLLYSDVKDIVLDSSIKEEGLPVVTLSNLNITAQKGCFVYHNDGLKPFEFKGLYCVDIHKSLVPYIRKDYLTANSLKSFKDTISEQTIYPNAGTVVEEALNDALSGLV